VAELATNLRRAALLTRRIADSSARRMTGRLEGARISELSTDAFSLEFEQAVGALSPALRERGVLLRVPADTAPWFDAGIDVEAGEEISWFANGRVHLSKLLDMFIEPHFQLWARIGDGNAFRGTRDTFTFTAEESGRLQFASYFPGEWTTPKGGFATPESAWKGVGGGMDVAVVRWQGSSVDGLGAMARSGYARAAREIERSSGTVPVPEDWNYLWFLGPGEIYQHRRDNGRTCIDCRTHCDAGILQIDVDVALTSATMLSWQWHVSELPSVFGEDILPTHDYMSIAVEYDNGIDVTYYWSAELPLGEGYWCPLPNWAEREFHIVVRSGRDGLGHWHCEERSLFDDYRDYIGEPPKRIKRVWLIANSLFQRRIGRCRYAEISVGEGDDRTVVL